MSIELIYHIAYALILGTLTILFIFHGSRKNRITMAVFYSILFGFLGEVISILIEFLQVNNLVLSIFYFLQVSFSSIQILFWYIHIERLESIRIKHFRYAIILLFFFLSVFSVFLTIIFYSYAKVVLILWIFSDFGYIALALTTFGIFGSALSFKSYKYTLDNRQLLFLCAYILIGIGAIIVAIGVIRDFAELGTLEHIFEILFYVGNFLSIFGQFLLICIYFSDLNYVYRLPFDVYLVLVFQKNSGNLASAVWLKTKKKIDLDVHLVSGMLTAMNVVFGDIFNDQGNIQEVKGLNAKLLFEVGKDLISVVICQETSYYLTQSLKAYMRAFETKFSSLIKSQTPNLQKIEETKDLVLEYFPYCEIDLEKQKIGLQNLKNNAKEIEDRFKRVF